MSKFKFAKIIGVQLVEWHNNSRQQFFFLPYAISKKFLETYQNFGHVCQFFDNEPIDD
jgi:hypothetical protein